LWGCPLTPAPLASLALSFRVSPDPLPQWAFRLVPRVAALPQSSGYTGRRILESPRFSRPSALPCLNLRVSPFPRSSGNASNRFSPSRPGFPQSSGSAEASSPGRPGSSLPSAAPDGRLSELPRIALPSVPPSLRHRVTPAPAING